MRHQRLTPGFSTLELLIAMAILAIVVTQILGVVSSQQRNFVVHEDVLETQEESRLVADMIVRELRMAGFMVPNRVGVGSVDGGSNGTDILCISNASVIDAGTLADMNLRFGGAKITATLGSDADSLTIKPSTLSIDSAAGNNSVDFAAGAGLIISDGNRSHCARIETFTSGSGAVGFTPSTPTGFSVTASASRIVPAIVYEVTANGIARNDELLSRQVEDLQVEFSVGGAWIDSIDGAQPADVDTVRVSVVARTERDDLEAVSGQRPKVANHNAGGVDNFRRRQLTNVVAPRNFM